MVVPDANLLIYAYQIESPQHEVAAAWLESALASPQIIGLSWPTLWAFLRINSNPRLWGGFEVPLDRLFDTVDEWLQLPNVVLVQPGPRHGQILREIMIESNTRGTRSTDAALAALAIEHAATLASTDRDFRRFSGLRWINPLD